MSQGDREQMGLDRAARVDLNEEGPDRTAVAARDLGSARVLLVDGAEAERVLVASALEQHGYDVVPLADGTGVSAALRQWAVDVIVLESGLTDAEGVDAVRAIRRNRRYADVPILLLADATDPEAGPPAEKTGADHVLVRPVDPVALLDRVQAALRIRRSLLGMEAAHAVVASLANELIAPEADIRLHTERLGTYAAELGRRVGSSASDLHAIAYGTLLHDLARLGIAEWILLKPGPLTEDEVEAMRRHTEIGERIAAPLLGSDRFGPILRHHHERWDGLGYPDGLRGEAIPVGARIIGVVDAFDAMTQYRIYRAPMSVPDAVAELRRGRGSQFDPDLVDTFIEVLQWDGLI